MAASLLQQQQQQAVQPPPQQSRLRRTTALRSKASTENEGFQLPQSTASTTTLTRNKRKAAEVSPSTKLTGAATRVVKRSALGNVTNALFKEGSTLPGPQKQQPAPPQKPTASVAPRKCAATVLQQQQQRLDSLNLGDNNKVPKVRSKLSCVCVRGSMCED